MRFFAQNILKYIGVRTRLPYTGLVCYDSAMGMMRRFIQWNKRTTARFWTRHGYADRRLYTYYDAAVRQALRPDMLVYDVGGGGYCSYYDAKETVGNFTLVGVDIEDIRLKDNATIDELIVADITKDIPLPHGKIDMITSSSVLEHLENQEAFIRNARAALKDGGLFIHVFPSRYALFAILNRLLTNRVAKKILFALHPNLKGSNGFKAYYDRTYYTAFQKLLTENGFTITDMQCNYYQSDYFGFFLPLYFISLGWDALCHACGWKNLCAQLCVTAVKNGD